MVTAMALGACNPVQTPPPALITVTISSIENTTTVNIPMGGTVEAALDVVGFELGEFDRVEPPIYTVLTDGSTIRVVQIVEEFDIEQVIIPFESQTLRNDALPEGERRLIQAGLNGIQEITYRRVYEDHVEISRNPVKVVMLNEPVAEIVMIGAQLPFTPVKFSGRLAYLIGGNAWVIEGETGERRPVVTTGDLDGRILLLSTDGDWLLYTRNEESDEVINSLWAANISQVDGIQVDLEARNVIHFADWVPGYRLRVSYSTVEPRATAPGWQANNDFYVRNFSESGWVSRPEQVVDSNAGGVYGWWGTHFVWSPSGNRLAFARPDGVGIVNLQEGSLEKIHDVTPLQTFGDWAWVPGLTWSPDENLFYTVNHSADLTSAAPETSQVFDMIAIPLEQRITLDMVSQTGMFAYPAPSPSFTLPNGTHSFEIALLQAIFPGQSETSRYQLVVMDRDGSNRKVLFPEDGAPGLEPQQVVWNPARGQNNEDYDLAFLYQGNLYFLNIESGESRQLTGDGLVVKINWK